MKFRPPPAPTPKTLVRKGIPKQVIHVRRQASSTCASFLHAGDIGDIIYSLPVIKHLGGGILYIEASAMTRQVLTEDKWCVLRTLLLAQPYIKGVHSWNGETIRFNLNKFRLRMTEEERSGNFRLTMSLAERVCESYDVPMSVIDAPWLTIKESNPIAEVVFARSERYPGPNFPWRRVYERYGSRAVFVGLPNEHQRFCEQVGRVPHHPTSDLLEVAKVIAGATLFVGNQSSPYAIAEGLKQNAILEVWPQGPNCLFRRVNCWPVIHHNIRLPDLNDLRSAHAGQSQGSNYSPIASYSDITFNPPQPV